MHTFILKTSIRNIFKNLKSNYVNIFGLAIGIAAFVILFIYVRFENSYDSFLPNSENIYRVQLNRYQKGELQSEMATSTYNIGPLMKEQIPGVKNYFRGGFERCMLFKEDVFLSNQPLLWTDSSLFEVFDLEIVKGTSEGALEYPYTAVLSESLAYKLFGNEDPVGKIFLLNEHLKFHVTAVYKDIPQNSHMNFQCFLSLSTGNDCERWPTNCRWGTSNMNWGGDAWLYTYITLHNGVDHKEVENKIAQLVHEKLPEQLTNRNINFKYTLQPVRDIHLNSHLEKEFQSNETKRNVNLVLLISILVIVIAWINYINISNSEVFEKAKNAGVRKVVGASKRNLFLQFMTETFIQNFISTILAVGLLLLALPFFDRLTGKELLDFFKNNVILYLLFPSLLVAGTLISGIIPSILLSSFKPVKVLSGKLFSGMERFAMKKLLIQFQLLVSFVLIIGLVVIFKQIRLMQTEDLGYDKENVFIVEAPLTLNMDDSKIAKFELLKDKLLVNTDISAISAKRWGIGQEVTYSQTVNKLEGSEINPIRLSRNTVDENFLEVFSMELLSGRNFSKDRAQNRNKVLINESAARKLGLSNPSEATGYYIGNTNNSYTYQVIGVIEDYHQESLRKEVKPSVFFCGHPRNFGQYAFKINSSNIHKTIELINKEWLSIYPNDGFSHFFLDNYIDSLYKSEVKFGKTLTVFTVLAILISCLGLLGLILITIRKNVKQVGVRKVNGASRMEILQFFIKDYILWNISAIIIGVPISYYVMKVWLSNYVIQTSLSWWVFALGALLTGLISIATISIQSWRAAGKNPVEALRYE
ncbi:MAG: ABC transporter permease [Bacteroidales bacterium]|nr:ABC transporter permease [Bacteroidales bacterium]